jgi:hypothetical protein
VEGAGQACGSGADDEDVGFELFALNGHGMDTSILSNRQNQTV